jgi:hypothetical protein
MAQLKDLRVDTVSFVDRAAVRDPQRKDEPRRLLLWKAEGGARGPQVSTASDLDSFSTGRTRAVKRQAVRVLKAHQDEPEIAALIDKLEAAA